MSVALSLEYDTQGLLPLFYVSIYTAVSENTVMELQNEALAMMDEAKNRKTEPESGSGAAVKYEGSGFDTPEDTAKAYLEGLRDADFSRMLSVFAIESLARNNDFEAGLRFYRYYFDSFWFPNVNSFTTGMNIESKKTTAVETMIDQYIVMCLYENDQKYPESRVIENASDASKVAAQIDEFFNAPKLSTLKVIGYIPPDRIPEFSSVLGGIELPETYFSEVARTRFNEKNSILGADKAASCLIVFEINALP